MGTVSGQRARSLLFGDLLALARLSWIRQMTERLADLGYDDYRRSDAVVFRRLLQGSVAIGRLGETLDVTRQAARKIADGLEQRGYAVTARDELDSRRVNVLLTSAGRQYGRAVVEVIDALNDELVHQVDPEQLESARSVLLEVITRGMEIGYVA